MLIFIIEIATAFIAFVVLLLIFIALIVITVVKRKEVIKCRRARVHSATRRALVDRSLRDKTLNMEHSEQGNPTYIFFYVFYLPILLCTLCSLCTETYNLVKRLQNHLSDNEAEHSTEHSLDQLCSAGPNYGHSICILKFVPKPIHKLVCHTEKNIALADQAREQFCVHYSTCTLKFRTQTLLSTGAERKYLETQRSDSYDF